MKQKTTKQNWRIEKLENLGKWGSGGTPLSSVKEYYKGDIKWAIIGDLNNSIIYETKNKITQKGLENSSAKLVPKDSLLVGMYGSIGKTAITGEEIATNQAIAFLIPNKEVNIYFVQHFIHLSVEKLFYLSRGGTQKNINQEILKAFEIPLPSLSEQALIVQEIEKHFSKLDSATKLLESIRGRLELYRKSVLKKAFEKKEGWEEKKIGEITEVISGSTPKTENKNYWGGDIYWITPKDLSGYGDKYISKTSRTITKEGYDSCSTTMIPENNVLMSSRAPIGYLVINKIPICTNQGFKSFRIIDRKKINEEFLYYYLKSIIEKIKKQGSGTTFNEISKNKAESILVSFPSSLSEQAEIVQYIESRFSIVDKVEQTVKASLDKIERLRKSILKSAFEGELVK